MKRLYLLYVMAAATLLSGCRKELCYDHDEHAFSVKVDVAATWEQEWERSYDTDWQSVWNPAWSQSYDDLRPGIPTGIRARVYGDGTAESEANLASEGGRLYMGEGTHCCSTTTTPSIWSSMTSPRWLPHAPPPAA